MEANSNSFFNRHIVQPLRENFRIPPTTVVLEFLQANFDILSEFFSRQGESCVSFAKKCSVLSSEFATPVPMLKTFKSLRYLANVSYLGNALSSMRDDLINSQQDLANRVGNFLRSINRVFFKTLGFFLDNLKTMKWLKGRNIIFVGEQTSRISQVCLKLFRLIPLITFVFLSAILIENLCDRNWIKCAETTANLGSLVLCTPFLELFFLTTALPLGFQAVQLGSNWLAKTIMFYNAGTP